MHLAARILQKQLAQKRKRPKLRALFPPQGIEYQRALVNFARLCERIIRERLVDQMPRMQAGSITPTASAPSSAASDSTTLARADDLGSDLERTLRTIRSILEAGGAGLARAVNSMLNTVQMTHARGFVEAYGTSLPNINPTIGAEDWLREQLDLATQENMRLIRSIPEQLLGDVQRIVVQGAMEGRHALEIGKQIEERFGMTERRARGIARDQTSKWHSAVHRLRCVDAGVTELEWSTSLDDRVRPTHRANHGKRFPINKPPAATGHAGHDPNCRCCEIPVVPEYEADGEGVDAEFGFEEARAAQARRLSAG